MKKQIQKIKTKLSFKGGLWKASALVVTMMIMGIILISTLSIALVAVQERKASLGEDSSNQAYNKAEDGVEIVLQDVIKGGHATVDQLANCNPASGRIENDGYTVELKDADEAKISCASTAAIASVRSVKSVGSAGGNQRAVQVAVAGTGDYQIACAGNFMVAGVGNGGCCRLDTSSGKVDCKVVCAIGGKYGWYKPSECGGADYMKEDVMWP